VDLALFASSGEEYTKHGFLDDTILLELIDKEMDGLSLHSVFHIRAKSEKSI
jgi:hypothetical protein